MSSLISESDKVVVEEIPVELIEVFEISLCRWEVFVDNWEGVVKVEDKVEDDVVDDFVVAAFEFSATSLTNDSRGFLKIPATRIRSFRNTCTAPATRARAKKVLPNRGIRSLKIL